MLTARRCDLAAESGLNVSGVMGIKIMNAHVRWSVCACVSGNILSYACFLFNSLHSHVLLLVSRSVGRSVPYSLSSNTCTRSHIIAQIEVKWTRKKAVFWRILGLISSVLLSPGSTFPCIIRWRALENEATGQSDNLSTEKENSITV